MRKLLSLSIFVLFFVMTGWAQSKKVAVWETKCTDNSISPLQSTMVRGGMETAVGNTLGYEVYDRSAFDAIMKEHNFQRSGAVSDSEIKRLGEMVGVQYIIVPEAIADGSEFYILVKMLDVESGKFGAVYDVLCGPSGAEIRKACAELGVKLFGGSVSNSQTGNTVTVSRGQNYTETAFGINMQMVYVEGGTFTMGCTSEQGGDCDADELPVHQVTLSDYYIGKYEVTVAEFRRFVNATGYRTDAEKEGWALRWMQVGDEWQWNKVYGVNWRCGTNGEVRNSMEENHPVLYVSWNDAVAYCEWLSQKTGKRYCLPTEAQWEFAARGGNKRNGYKYAGGNSINNVAWYGNVNRDGTAGGQTHPVGQKSANELGICDMSGNVLEWCQDWYGGYSSASQTDPQGPSSGSRRVLRGGSWYSDARNCRVSNRISSNPAIRIDIYGFRLCLPQ